MAFDPNQKEDDGDIDLVLDVAEGELIAMSGEDNEGDGPPTDPDMPDLIIDSSDEAWDDIANDFCV